MFSDNYCATLIKHFNDRNVTSQLVEIRDVTTTYYDGGDFPSKTFKYVTLFNGPYEEIFHLKSHDQDSVDKAKKCIIEKFNERLQGKDLYDLSPCDRICYDIKLHKKINKLRPPQDEYISKFCLIHLEDLDYVFIEESKIIAFRAESRITRFEYFYDLENPSFPYAVDDHNTYYLLHSSSPKVLLDIKGKLNDSPYKVLSTCDESKLQPFEFAIMHSKDSK